MDSRAMAAPLMSAATLNTPRWRQQARRERVSRSFAEIHVAQIVAEKKRPPEPRGGKGSERPTEHPKASSYECCNNGRSCRQRVIFRASTFMETNFAHLLVVVGLPSGVATSGG